MKNKINFFKKPTAKTKLCALGLTGVIIATGLTGCGCIPENVNDNTVEENVVDKINVDSILLNIGKNVFSLKINKCDRWHQGMITITLVDGSTVIVNEKNIIPYNYYSSILGQLNNDVIYIKKPKTKRSYKDPNTIALNYNNKVYKTYFKKYDRFTPGFCEFTLQDNSIAYINEMNFILYNDESPMMKQVEEIIVDKTLNKSKQKLK